MTDLNELYQEVILDHNQRPRNFAKLEGANRQAEGYNPLCGDHLTVYLRLEGDVIQDISFQGSGCAISKASASMMTAALKGKARDEATALFKEVHKMLTGTQNGKVDWQTLGKLKVLSGVSQFPVRVKCATLPWHTLNAALEGKEETISTE
jgi:nitrogen fixation NifU-like protein